ncbi:hypothetical protein K7W42_15145 [Deinococcus sp. HMF7604]|uniref:hypothetical protein n=1 Tax=Deinococcus betulae TaxID=2873312 RepID=UPI001CCE7595|nr:hypothetical protein [Deinococcus betulae]MBZ9752190.1 hypothetical protein [Deinococcus betulae]
MSLIDARVRPNAQVYRNRSLIEVIDLAQLKTWRDNKCALGSKASSSCPTFEFSVPFLLDPTNPLRSSLDVSRDVAGALQYEWQRFQDKTRWAVSVDLNRSVSAATVFPLLPYATRPLGCTPILNSAGELAIAAAKVLAGNPEDITKKLATYQLSVPSGVTHKDFKLPSGLKFEMKADGVELPNYVYPRVPRSEYCAGREAPDLIPDSAYPLPGTVYMPSSSFYGISGPNYPMPAYFNWDEVRSRIRNTCNEAVKQYYREYQENVLKLLATKMPEAMHWNGYTNWSGNKSGIIFAPVAGLIPNITKVASVAQKAQLPQFATYLTAQTAASQLISNQSRSGGKLVQLEELKRWLEVGSLADASTQGAVNLFQTWQQLEPMLDKRPQTFFAHARYCTLQGCVNVPVPMLMPDTVVTPAGCTVSPANGGLGTMTFALPAAHFAWVAVPEGMPIPGLAGSPTLRAP